MQLTCPECHFAREVDENTIPSTATKATCPKCGVRFSFRDATGMPIVPYENVQPEPYAEQATHADEPSAESPNIPDDTAEAENSEHTYDPAVYRTPTVQEGDDPLPQGARIPPTPEKELLEDASPAQQNSVQNTQQPARFEEEFFQSATRNLEAEVGNVPWERAVLQQMPQAFFQTILQVLFHPADFFSRIGKGLSQVRPIAFYLILGIFQVVVMRFWYINNLQALSNAATDPQLQATLTSAMNSLSLPMMLIISPFSLLFQLYLMAGLFYLMLRMTQPATATVPVDFNVVMRVIAYSSAPSVFCIVPLVGPLIASFWFIACTFVGCKYAFNLEWGKVVLALLPILLLGFALSLQLTTMMTSAMGG